MRLKAFIFSHNLIMFNSNSGNTFGYKFYYCNILKNLMVSNFDLEATLSEFISNKMIKTGV